MQQTNLPDRGIDIRPARVLAPIEETRDIDEHILHVLRERPATTAYVAQQIDEQAGYVSQRLSHLANEDVLVPLDRGFYELHGEVCPGE